jgi:hypothetical protein
MRRNCLDHAAGSQDKALSAGLGQGVFEFDADFGRVAQGQGFASQPAADDAGESFLSLGKIWLGVAVVPVQDLHRVIGHSVEIDALTVQVGHVEPQRLGGFQQGQVIGAAKGVELLAAELAGAGVLDGVEDAVNAGFDGCFDEAACAFGNDFQSALHLLGMMAQVQEQGIAADQVFGLRQGIENGLNNRFGGRQLLPEQTQAF